MEHILQPVCFFSVTRGEYVVYRPPFVGVQFSRQFTNYFSSQDGWGHWTYRRWTNNPSSNKRENLPVIGSLLKLDTGILIHDDFASIFVVVYHSWWCIRALVKVDIIIRVDEVNQYWCFQYSEKAKRSSRSMRWLGLDIRLRGKPRNICVPPWIGQRRRRRWQRWYLPRRWEKGMGVLHPRTGKCSNLI